MYKSLLYFLLSTSSMLFFISCDKDVTDITNEEELITTIIYTLTPDGGGTPITLSFRDIDGNGGNDPIITGGTLTANQTYNGSLTLLNESISPVGNITMEIEEEAEDHQFFFSSNISGLITAYNDQDSNGQPIGLKSILTTGSPSSGAITIILRHQPDKSAPGVSAGAITNAGGETDIEVSLPVIIL